ncbi:putative secondary thiamine-phosphate synthase enzyme [Blattamonas nauphoetae]|uniref:Secondary thiamine-phosphate synthase enzyme n=1 Tax=Blattamonas nauphoetae TaxID=2049346 RepID=A0ABQ9XZZ1_9EUKA|nr:putative secondary thiamine-phosphate synthase enzyme [Blattamonas nauphoetae]
MQVLELLHLEAALRESGIKEGLCLVNAMHITASVFINDNESGLYNDFARWLEQYVPWDPPKYQHNQTGEDNGSAHIRRQLFGREVVVAITNGALDFGPWEQIFYGEHDGKRSKRVLIKLIGSKEEHSKDFSIFTHHISGFVTIMCNMV